MGLFDRLADRIVDRIEKRNVAGLGNIGNARTLTAEQMQAGQSIDNESAALGRNPMWGAVPFAPGVPTLPAAITPSRAEGLPADPRRFEYPVSWNLPGAGMPLTPWQVLRQLSVNVSPIRRCIELRKSELAGYEWNITVRPMAVDKRLGKGASAKDRVRARREILDDYHEQIIALNEFWVRPDKLNDLIFSEWLQVALEEYFVLDALAIYPWRTLGGDTHSFVVIDGTTIKPLLDINGNTPQPPDPAFQQILYGFPRGDYSSTSPDGKSFTQSELVYRPRHVRAFSPYGFSPTEQAIIDANLWMKRQEWLRDQYDEGVVPAMFMKADKEVKISPELLKQQEEIFNAELEGQTARRQKARFLPPGYEPVEAPQFEAMFKSDFDEFMLKLLCSPFGVLPTQLGFTPSTGLGGKGHQEGEEQTQQRMGTKPLTAWISAWLNELSYTYLGMPRDLTWSPDTLDIEDDFNAARARDIDVRNGSMTINEARSESGRDPLDEPDADRPFIVAGASITFLGDEPAGSLAAATSPEKKQPEEPTDTSEADNVTVSDEAAEEMKKFATFAKRRRNKSWRPFAFAEVPESLASQLNAAGSRGDWELVDELVSKVA